MSFLDLNKNSPISAFRLTIPTLVSPACSNLHSSPAASRRVKDLLSRMTDADSWLNHWPIRVRAGYPMLFDRNFRPKPAVAAVIQTAPHQRNCRDLQLPIQLSAR